MNEMLRLFREIRFSVNPFGPPSLPGFNSYVSKPCGDGLAVYLSLGVELSGVLNPDTGFIINVSEIDKLVRADVLPVFQETICRHYADRRPLVIQELFALLEKAGKTLQSVFSPSVVSRLVLSLNPYRKITLLREDQSMRLYSERFEFAAMHRLWNDRLTEAENFKQFGKCANPAGHGHNYILEVTVRISENIREPGWISLFQQTVQEQFLELVDHKNLNQDVPEFSLQNPTVENLSVFAWENLAGKFDGIYLDKIRIWENDRTCCTYIGS